MINILHAIDTTGPGGAETVFIELLSRLDPQHYHPVIVIRGKGWVYDELQRRGFKPYIVPAKGSFNVRYLMSLVKIIRNEKIDLIQSHLFGSNVYCCLAGFLTRTPVVATFHGAVDFEGERFLNAKFFIINKIAARIVLVSQELMGRLTAKVALNEKKLSIIYNGIATDGYGSNKNNKLREKFGFSNDDIIVGSLGNIRPAKGYEILLQAASLVAKDLPNMRFVIAGDNNNALYQKLLGIRADLGLESTVHFLGFCNNTCEYLNGIDIFCLSSFSEGCPVSVVEAMATGVPMVVTNCGGLTEMVEDGVSAMVCAPNSPSELARALTQLGSELGLRADLVKHAAQVVEEKFTTQKMLKAYADIYAISLKKG